MRLIESVSFWIILFSAIIGLLVGQIHWILGVIIFFLIAGKSAIYGLVMDTISGSLEYHHDRQDMRAKKKMESLAYLKYGAKGNIDKIGTRGPAGGIVFYDKGYYSDGWRYLEVAPEEYSDVIWGLSEEPIPWAQNTGIGFGKSNTQAINDNYFFKGHIASKICTEYRGGGKSDWFLPSKDELNALYNSGVITLVDNYYWSSSEYDTSTAWFQNFSYGFQKYFYKNTTLNLRAIRSF